MNYTFIKRIIAKRAFLLPAFIVLLSIFAFGALQPSEAKAISKPTQSSTVQYQPRITAPNAPTSPTAVAGNVQATITWVAPASNGGAAITGYTVTSSPVVATPTACKAVNALTCIFTGLTNGTSYTYPVSSQERKNSRNIRSRIYAAALVSPDLASELAGLQDEYLARNTRAMETFQRKGLANQSLSAHQFAVLLESLVVSRSINDTHANPESDESWAMIAVEVLSHFLIS